MNPPSNSTPVTNSDAGAGGDATAHPKSSVDSRANILFFLALGLLTAYGCGLRSAWIDHPMRYDEAYSAVYYVARSDWFNYQEPNNHVLNTLLMQLCAWVGGYSPPVMRLPAFLCGVLMIPAAGFAALSISGRRMAALLAAGFVATSGILVEYSTNARGYSLVALATLLLFILTARLARNPVSRSLWAGWCAVAIAGLFAIPIMLQAVALMVLVFVLAYGIKGRRTIAALLGSLSIIALVTACLYAPVVRQNGLHALVANRWVAAEGLDSLRADSYRLVADIWDQWSRDSSPLNTALILTGLLAAAVCCFKKRNVFYCVPLPAFAVICFFILLQRRAPPARVCLYVLSLVFATAAAGLAWLAELISKILGARMPVVTGLCLVIAICGWEETHRALQKRDYMISENPGTCTDAEGLVKYLGGQGLYSGRIAVTWDMEVSAPFLYYFFLQHPQNANLPPEASSPSCEEVFMIVRNSGTVSHAYLTTPGLSRLFTMPKLVRTFPTATVFLCQKR